MADQRGSIGNVFIAQQSLQEADTVFTRVVGKPGLEQIRAGGHKIGVTDRPVAVRTGLNFRRPAHDERDAMTTFPDVRFGATQGSAGVMTRIPKNSLRIAGWRKSIVTRGNHKCVIGQTQLIKQAQHLTNRGIGLHHKIGVISQPAFSLPFFCWQHRSMR